MTITNSFEQLIIVAKISTEFLNQPTATKDKY